MRNFGYSANQLSVPASFELGLRPPEFISPQAAQCLVVMAMEGRVDPATGQLLPLTEERVLLKGPGYAMKPLPAQERYDMVLPVPPQMYPYEDGGTLRVSYDHSVSDRLYHGLTKIRSVNLGAADVERLMYDQENLEQTLEGRHDLRWALRREQNHDAYHVAQKDTPAPGGDGQLVSPVRVYVPAGKQGVQIANQVIQAGADFAGAKIWTPQAAYGEQSIRQDTPIFIANTAAQLRSVVGAVRSVATQGLIRYEDTPPVGIPIDGGAGAFVAQPAGQSFNSEMAQFWSEPIRTACNSLPLHAGDVVTHGWVDEAARRATAIAQEQVVSAGVNPDCLALLAGQDVAVVTNAISG